MHSPHPLFGVWKLWHEAGLCCERLRLCCVGETTRPKCWLWLHSAGVLRSIAVEVCICTDDYCLL